jgi:hypothetical protein
MNTRQLSAALALLSGLVALAAGQDTTVQIRAVLQDSAKPDAKFFVGKASEALLPLKLAEEGLTESQKVSTENGSINLFSSDTIDKANPLASLAATVKIPAGLSRLILIIVPAGQGTTPPYRMLAVDDNPTSFPWGESKAINLTPVDFALEVGDQRLLLPGGKVTAVPKVTKLDEYNRAQTNFYYKQGDQWVVASERQMQFVGNLRRLFLIYKAPDALAPDVRALVDQQPVLLDRTQ